MSSRLPPLSWLRAFEAAGRLQSFRAAAAELHVTPSAISHHVRALEERVGRPLFVRTGSGVALTREGEAYLARVSAGFETLAAAGDVLEAPAAGRRLRLGGFPFLVSEVLVPNLAGLRERLPGVALKVSTETDLVALTRADPEQRLDAVIRYGSGRFPGYSARKLTDVALVPVAAPALLAAARDTPEVLIHQGPRVAVAGPYSGWAMWTAGSGIAVDAAAEVVAFDSYLSAMRATEQGLGVGIGVLPFVDLWLAAGRLAVVLDVPVPAQQGAYLVTGRYAAARPELDVLADWLQERFGGEG